MKKEKEFQVLLTYQEMQYIANSLGAYFEMLARSKHSLGPERAVVLATALKKMGDAALLAEQEPQIIVQTN